MHKAGLKHIKDVWHDGAFLPTEEVSRLYGLKNCEFRAWDLHTQAMTRYWGTMLTGIDHWSSPGEWLGIFQNLDPLPAHVFCSPGGRNWQVERPAQNFYLPLKSPLFIVMRSACCLIQVSDESRLRRATINLGEPESCLSSTLRRVRVASISRGPKKAVTNLYYGRTD
jgi:hypothetical protein